MKPCIESQLYTVQVESERWTLHTKHNLKHRPTPHPRENKGRPLHSMTQLLIACMEILLLKLAATIFGLD